MTSLSYVCIHNRTCTLYKYNVYNRNICSMYVCMHSTMFILILRLVIVRYSTHYDRTSYGYAHNSLALVNIRLLGEDHMMLSQR